MNKELLEARKAMRGQKASMDTSGKFDNSPITPGKYIAVVMKAEMRGTKAFTALKIDGGQHNGRWVFPFASDTAEPDGIIQVSRDIARITGESLPWEKGRDGNGNVVLDFDLFYVHIEAALDQLIDSKVEIQVKNGTKLKDDGTPWQQIYINRGLGDDASSSAKEESSDSGDAEDVTSKLPKKKTPAKVEEPTKKKAIRKKA